MALTAPPRRGTGAARDLGLGLAATAATVVLSLLLVRSALGVASALPVSAAAPATALDALLIAAVTGLGALVAAWYAISAAVGTCCAFLRVVGSTWRVSELFLRRRGAPGIARLVGAGTGAVLTAGLVLAPAQAEPPEPTPDPQVAEDLTWASAAAGPEDEPPAEADISDPEQPTASAEAPGGHNASAESDEYVVQPGDTLWAIAAGHLGGDASAAQIARSWPAWYEANRTSIGSDPDLILPGTRLHPPD